MTWYAVGAAAVGLVTSGINNHEGSGAIDSASDYQIQAGLQGLDQQRNAFDLAQEYQQPFFQAGHAQLPYLQQGAGAGGFGETMRQLLQGGSLNPMIEQQQQQGMNQLSQAGLMRSGFGANQMARIPMQAAMNAENTLANRQQSLAGMGQTAGLNLGAAGQAHAGSMGALLQGMGAAQASGTLGKAQLQNQFTNNAIKLGSSVANNYWG